MKQRRRVKRVHWTSYQTLEPRQLLAADLFITEFMASNKGTLDDGNGRSSDWIELYNGGDSAVNLLGYSLTDDPNDPNKFVLPTQFVNPGSYVLVFASGDNAPDSNNDIHANFQLSASGEYLGLYDPEGILLSEFGSSIQEYPEQVTDVSFGLDVSGGEYLRESQRYFLNPSPRTLNTPSTGDLAPLVSGIDKLTSAAVDGEDIVVTAKPISLNLSISSVVLRARVNYEAETQLTMLDNGQGNDAVAGDGIYTGTIPASLFDQGDMVRWRVIATASNGSSGKAPTFLNATKSPEYFGTVVADSSIDTPLPVFEWFTANVSAATGTGGRGSVFYNGEFYDNVFVRKRGQSSNNSPKKNLKFDFNPGDRFLLEPGAIRVDEVNVNNTYYDQADVRQTLSYETFAAIDQPAPISFPMHTRLNGDFYSLAIYVEQVDAEFLERNGLDPHGALYKADGGSVGNNGFNEAFGIIGFLKRTRLNEGNSALLELANAVDPNLPQELRAQYLYDHVDIYSVINYLAGSTIIHNADHLGKNHYVYQDTDGTGKWSFLPWDLDLTFGKNGANTPNIEVYDADVTDQSSNRYPNSHPFFGASEYPRFGATDLYNRLIDAVHDTPEFREMYLRRLRSAMDLILQSPDTNPAELKFEARLLELLADIQDDWTRDDAKWIETPQFDHGRGTDWGEDLPLATHITRIIDRYLEPRRNHLYNTHNITNAVTPGVEQRLFETTNPVRYVVPATEIAGWQSNNFDDSTWTLGNQGVGYERGSGYQSLIGSDVESETYNAQRSVYTRASFNIASQADLDAITSLLLEIRYDDGFIAYINGVEAARSSNVTGSGINATTGSHEAGSLEPIELNSVGLAALQVGTNTLAVQVINSIPNSSDLLLQYALTASDGVLGNDIAGIPNEQAGNPSINFDTIDFDASPISGSQAQEYLRLNNPNSTAVDISGWRLSGGVELTFRPGTVIPAQGKIYAVADVKSFLARTTGPSGEQRLLTHGNYDGQLGFAGETILLLADDGQVMDTFEVPATTGTDLQSFLRISEISYNPNTSSGSEEFIEFVNISSGGESITLDLSGARITDGPSTPFVFPTGTMLAPGERLVVVKDIGAFWGKYPDVPFASILANFSGSLSNGGERLRVEDAGGNTIVDIDYGDSNPWPDSSDGDGATLTLVDEAGTAANRVNKHYAWRASVINGGTPGQAPALPSGILINEVLANTDAPLLDSIELFNSSDSAIDVSGWYLSDSADNPEKFPIPANTIIAAGGFLVFDENDFNPTPENPGINDFALNGSDGDQVYLTQIVDGQITRFEDVVYIGASFEGESLGRQDIGTQRLSRLASITLGSENSAFKTGPLVLSEVQYHPAEPSPAAVAEFPSISKSDLEFIEIVNPTGNSVSLQNWRLRGEADFDFTGQSLSPDQAIVVVSFDPDTANNSDLVAAFEAHYGIANANLVGPFSGTLSNSFGRVTLQQPDVSPPDNPSFTPRVAIDEVVYDDLSPWPDADGSGVSLNRNSGNSYGNLASNWQADSPSPGTASLRLNAPTVVETLRDGGSLARPDLWSTIEIVFDQDVSVPENSLTLFNDSTGGTNVDMTGVTFVYSSSSFTATWNVAGLALPSGIYRYSLAGNEITGVNGGLGLDGNSDGNGGDDYSASEYVAIPGDSDLDGDVDVLGDAFTLVQNLGTQATGTWATGDFNGDGNIDVLGDAFALVQNLGSSILPSAGSAVWDQPATTENAMATTKTESSLKLQPGLIARQASTDSDDPSQPVSKPRVGTKPIFRHRETLQLVGLPSKTADNQVSIDVQSVRSLSSSDGKTDSLDAFFEKTNFAETLVV